MSDSANCPNCHNPLEGQFCYACGQNQKGIDRFFFTLINEAFEDIFSVKSRAWQTLFALLLKPGFLTNEYFAGRRARYVQPIRLYLVSSIVFFALFSLANFLNNKDRFADVLQEPPTEQVVSSETADEDTTSIDSSDSDSAADTGIIQIPTVDSDGNSSEPAELDFGGGDFKVSFLDDEQEQKLKKILERQILKAREDPDELKGNLIELAPPILFILVPLFALLLKIMYLFKGRYYTEHLILAVHNHCFLFVMLTFNLLIENGLGAWPAISTPLEAVFLLWIPIYMWFSLKQVYRQGFWMTSFKYIVLGMSYSMLLVFSIAIALLVGLMTI